MCLWSYDCCSIDKSIIIFYRSFVFTSRCFHRHYTSVCFKVYCDDASTSHYMGNILFSHNWFQLRTISLSWNAISYGWLVPGDTQRASTSKNIVLTFICVAMILIVHPKFTRNLNDLEYSLRSRLIKNCASFNTVKSLKCEGENVNWK